MGICVYVRAAYWAATENAICTESCSRKQNGCEELGYRGILSSGWEDAERGGVQIRRLTAWSLNPARISQMVRGRLEWELRQARPRAPPPPSKPTPPRILLEARESPPQPAASPAMACSEALSRVAGTKSGLMIDTGTPARPRHSLCGRERDFPPLRSSEDEGFLRGKEHGSE